VHITHPSHLLWGLECFAHLCDYSSIEDSRTMAEPSTDIHRAMLTAVQCASNSVSSASAGQPTVRSTRQLAGLAGLGGAEGRDGDKADSKGLLPAGSIESTPSSEHENANFNSELFQGEVAKRLRELEKYEKYPVSRALKGKKQNELLNFVLDNGLQFHEREKEIVDIILKMQARNRFCRSNRSIGRVFGTILRSMDANCPEDVDCFERTVELYWSREKALIEAMSKVEEEKEVLEEKYPREPSDDEALPPAAENPVVEAKVEREPLRLDPLPATSPPLLILEPTAPVLDQPKVDKVEPLELEAKEKPPALVEIKTEADREQKVAKEAYEDDVDLLYGDVFVNDVLSACGLRKKQPLPKVYRRLKTAEEKIEEEVDARFGDECVTNNCCCKLLCHNNCDNVDSDDENEEKVPNPYPKAPHAPEVLEENKDPWTIWDPHGVVNLNRGALQMIVANSTGNYERLVRKKLDRLEYDTMMLATTVWIFKHAENRKPKVMLTHSPYAIEDYAAAASMMVPKQVENLRLMAKQTMADVAIALNPEQHGLTNHGCADEKKYFKEHFCERLPFWGIKFEECHFVVDESRFGVHLHNFWARIRHPTSYKKRLKSTYVERRHMAVGFTKEIERRKQENPTLTVDQLADLASGNTMIHQIRATMMAHRYLIPAPWDFREQRLNAYFRQLNIKESSNLYGPSKHLTEEHNQREME
jgi:hypothetical protein